MERYDSTYLGIFDSDTSYSNLLQLADGNLRTEDGFTFDIHRVILASKSEYFRCMFCGFDRDRREFTVPGISGRCLAEVLRYVYTEENCVNAENMAEVLRAAEYLLIKNLHREIKEIFKDYLTTSNCVQVLDVANLISDEEIARGSFRFVQRKFEEIVRTSKLAILDLSFETLKDILSSRSLHVRKESLVWETIVEWTERDTSKRFCHVPQLLMCLASKELDENLSLRILQHDIVSKNPYMENLQKIKSSTDSISNMDIILHFLENYPDAFKNSNEFRIPSDLHVISPCDYGIDKLYITFDENIDLWRKIGDIDLTGTEFLEVVGRHVYLFGGTDRMSCTKFDRLSRESVPMQIIRDAYDVYSVTHIDEYLLGAIEAHDNNFTYTVEVYDTVDTWLEGTSLLEIYTIRSVTLGKKIYVVGKMRDRDRIMMQVFDPATLQSSQLSPPIEYRNRDFAIVTYHKKIYLIGGNMTDEHQMKIKAEAYNPETDTWESLPDLPNTYYYIHAIVINDRIIVYDDHDSENMKNVCWNDAAGEWEKLEPTCALRDFDGYLFANVDDVDYATND